MLILFLLIFSYPQPEEIPVQRNLASGGENVLDKIKAACEMSSAEVAAYSLCGPYKKVKSKIEKEGDEIAKQVTDFITPSGAAVSGFLLKSLYEKKILLEVRTGIGNPSVSITNTNTTFSWSIEHNF